MDNLPPSKAILKVEDNLPELIEKAICYTKGWQEFQSDHIDQILLRAMIERIVLEEVLNEVEALLSDLLDANVYALKGPYCKEPVTVHDFFGFVDKTLDSISAEDAARILSTKARQYEFHYSLDAPAQYELKEFVDERLNAVLVKHLMTGLRGLIKDGKITKQECMDLTYYSLQKSSEVKYPMQIKALERSINKLLERNPVNKIVYLSIGCGNGVSDSIMVDGLQKIFPDLKLQIIGFDPFQTDSSNNAIVTQHGGQIITRELAEGETFLDIVRNMTQEDDPIIIATERYALHHMRRTTARFMNDLEGITLISIEHPMNNLQRSSVYHRLVLCGNDLLMNYAFEERLGGSWIKEALKNSELFSCLYKRTETLKTQQSDGLIILEQFQNKWPEAYVITYPERYLEQSQIKIATRKFEGDLSLEGI